LRTNISRLLRRALNAHAAGDPDRAERLYNALLQYSPANFDALHGLGQIHLQRGSFHTALVLFQEALKADSGRAAGFASLGVVFHLLKHFRRALASYEAGLCIEPDNADLLNRHGAVLLDLNRPLEALVSLERVLAAVPAHLDALGNYGNALIKLNRPLEALAAYDRALAVAPDNAQLLTNRAAALRRLDRPQEAIVSARRALLARPDFAQARFVESVARLTLGAFEEGWRGYEARWSVGQLASQRRNFTSPLWLGKESLAGKTILLHAEQGFGDTLQFVRYAPLLRKRGACSVILEVQRELVRLVSGSMLGHAGIERVVPYGETLPPFDFCCPLLSLPLAFETTVPTIPAEVPYLLPDARDICRWRESLPRRRPLVGLVWSGERSHDNDLNRSLPLKALLPLLDLPDISFVSLQHAVREEDIAALRGRRDICHIGESFADFADTAAALSVLDAVIAVDTAVAHLCGAVGKPLFLLLPFAADYRWLRERKDSPWYPTARLSRQPKFGDWESVIETLRMELPALLRQTAGTGTAAARKLSAYAAAGQGNVISALSTCHRSQILH
jgi:tetratricopeptide (TPR) repeat protein